MQKKKAFFRTVAVLLTLCLLLPLSACRCDTAPLVLRVLDVGQGDAALLCVDGEAMLIDTGSAVARDQLLGALDAAGVEALSYLLLTHPHEDHCGNARAVIERLHVDTLLTGGAAAGDDAYLLALEAAEREGVSHTVLVQNDRFSLGGALCEVLLAAKEEGNNGSVVLRVSYRDTVLLFTGDIEADAEAALQYFYNDGVLDCDFLKVAHLGSRGSSGESFLAVTTPRLAAISCGRDNDYDLPHGEVLDCLQAAGASVARTDLSGTLCYYCDGSDIWLEDT